MEVLGELMHGDPFDRLDALRRESGMFAIFREVFPEEFDALDFESLRREGETRAGVMAFARLVSERLFPLHLEAIEECGLGGIGFISFIDHESDWSYPQELPSALALALYLNHSEFFDVDDPRTVLLAVGLGEDEAARVPAPLEAGQLIFSLDAALDTEPTVLRRLGSIALIPARETGSVFYDGCCMCGSCDSIDWSVANVRALADHYHAACELARAVRTLSKWLDVDRPRRVARAVGAWNRAVERERSRCETSEVDAA